MCAVRLGYEFFVRAEFRIPESAGMSWEAQALESFVVAQMIFEDCGFGGIREPIERVKASLRGSRGVVFRKRRIDVSLKNELVRGAMLGTIGEVGERHSSTRRLVSALDGWLPEGVAAVLLSWE